MIDLKTNKITELSFKLNIEGANETPKSRLVIELKEGKEITIPADVSGGKATVKIPSLNTIKEEFAGKTAKCYLEVIVGDSYFTPWKETFQLKSEVTVVAESTQPEIHEAEEKPTISISMDSFNEVTMIEEPIREEAMDDEADYIEEPYDLEKEPYEKDLPVNPGFMFGDSKKTEPEKKIVEKPAPVKIEKLAKKVAPVKSGFVTEFMKEKGLEKKATVKKETKQETFNFKKLLNEGFLDKK